MSRKIIATLLMVSLLCSMFLDAGSMAAAEVSADPERTSLNIQKTLTAPIIDGQLNESMWDATQPMPIQIGTGAVQPSSFGMMWDYSYLYIAVNIEDDALIHDGGGYWFDQDHIGLFFDPTLHQSAPFIANDMQIGLVYQPDTTTPAFYFGAAPNHAGKDEKKILRAIQTTASGWSAEIAIPWDMLDFDPVQRKELGMQIGVTDRDTEETPAVSSMWSNYNMINTFWNDTSGYGTLLLDESSPVDGPVSDLLLDENFDGYADGETPFGWISDVNAGSLPMSVVQGANGEGGQLVFDGSSAGKQARITAPVQWDNYTVEADVTFQEALDSARWAGVMFRVPSNGKHPYNQMAVRQNGSYEIAYRTPENSWIVPVKGSWGTPLVMNTAYSFKLRVYDNNVKEYIKAASDPAYTLLTENILDLNLLSRGKVGLQADQSKVAFDNVKVTRITVTQFDMTAADTLEALSGAAPVSFQALYSDGINESVPANRVKLYSSDESVIRIVNNQIVPVREGEAQVKAVYGNATAESTIVVTPSTTGGAKVVKLAHDKGYLLANAGETIDLQALVFSAEMNDLTTAELSGDALTWTAIDEGVDIVDGMLTSTERAGIFKVKAEKDGANAQLIVVAKNTDDEEYVLYEENFDAVPNGTLPEGWTRIEGTTAAKAAVNGGVLELDARTSPDNPSRLTLPDYLGLFGDYRIEADITHAAVNDSSRWNSIMYRIQNNDYPYYQMAVRQNATTANGTEFAERTPANGWNVMETASYSEAIQAAKMYHYQVIAKGNRVQQSIDGTVLIDSEAATAYASGTIGLQANGSQMKVDNVKVTLQLNSLPPLPAERFVNVMEPQTSISLAPSIVAAVNSAAELAQLTGDATPATVMLHVDAALNVTDSTGNDVIGTVSDVVDIISGRIIPAFYVKDEAAVDAVVAWMKAQQLEDAFIVSSQGELVKKARLAYPILRGIVDFQSAGTLSHEALMDIRRTTNASLAKIALLPADAVSRENTAYLQERLITVWAKTTGQADGSLELHQLITAGTNGIVTDRPAMAKNALSVYDNQTTLIRKPLMIGHRGIPAIAPENTLEGASLAYDYGADVVENDIYLTKDNQIVIMHDPTLERTTNGTGNIEDYTMAELKLLKANKQFPAQYPNAQIPTLAEFFDTYKGKDLLHFVEIKSYKPEIIDALVQLINEKGVEDQVVVISFNGEQLKLLGQKMPGMSVGYLTGGYANEANISKSLRTTLQAIQPLNATFNTSYPGLGKNFMEASKHRGITIWPWTYRDQGTFVQYYQLGTYGLTTDYANWASNWASDIAAKQESIQLKVGESADLTAITKTYKGDQNEVTPTVLAIDGADLATIDGNRVTAVKPGTAHVLLRYSFTTDLGNSYDLYTQPVAIEIQEKEPEARYTLQGSVVVPKLHKLNDLSGFTVRLKKGKQVVAETVTDVQGKYTIPFEERHAYTVEIHANSYVKSERHVVPGKKETIVTVKPMTMYVGDFNRNGRVDLLDIAAIAKVVGKQPEGDRVRYDTDKDGDIDKHDVAVVKNNLGRR
ncbi:glycerophosphodiester phosphodiesterase family protein [Paenibacillus mendelii]|uniref:Glycerophosphodiester phosphodiesterase family protein n=1 Tax=Paenibacillus mendelii TaxID=206163 RepID=A0ABV6JF68_9BACL|nr:glycerophosphodiester phosphodiesterase family protein [Paenibacillus mendelii]MCQ6557387.1 DUF1080 domain-containing protein [Paenibacillus mendelii]